MPIKRKNLNNHSPAHGFTLIEVMVVVVIIGIILSFVMLSFGDFGAQRRLNAKAQHFSELVKLLKLKSVIGADTFGIDIREHSYTFYRFVVDHKTPYGRWDKIKDKRLFLPFIDNDVFLKLNRPTKKEQPDIIISSNGTISPFALRFQTKSASTLLSYNKGGTIEIK